jgi:phosphohistidine phosphatase
VKLFLVRHGVAVAHGARRTDAVRPLTRAGRLELEQVAERLAALEIRFDVLMHSPLRRAAETAELLVPLLDGRTQVEPGLAERADELDLGRIAGDRVALVGHQPYLGQLAALLVTGSTAAAARFPFAKAGVLWLEGKRVAPGSMALVAMLPPTVLATADPLAR